MADLHGILFTMQILYSLALGVWATYQAAWNRPLTGGFWGSVAVYAVLNSVILLVGGFLFFRGFTIDADGRVGIYFLYMLFLIVIMPGLFSMLHGRDDRRATIYFAALALFNASVSFSMLDRGLATWIASTGV